MLCPNQPLCNGAARKLKTKIDMGVEKPFLSTAYETHASKVVSEDEAMLRRLPKMSIDKKKSRV